MVVRLAGMLEMLTVRTAGARRFGSASGWAGPVGCGGGSRGLGTGAFALRGPLAPRRGGAAEGPGRGPGAARVCPVRAGSGDAGDNL